MKTVRWIAARAFALLALGAAAAPASAFTFTVNYTDAAGTGFNDTTGVSPVGGNTGTTLGAQRKQAFEFAVNVWAQRIQSSVGLLIDADWADLSCSASAATLGSAGPTLVITSGLPQANTYYPAALVNAIKGSDVLPANADIVAHFNKGIDAKPVGGCLGTKKFYYGLDQNFGSDIGFINVVVHEIGHGLGFTSLVNAATGAAKFGDGKFSIFDYALYDETTSLFLPLESNSQRAAVAISGSSLTFNSANTNGGIGFLTDGKTNTRARMFAPNPSQSGSSLSHWDTTATPNLVMEPIYTPLDGGAHVDLTTCAFKDIGWSLIAPFACPDIAASGADLSLTKVDSPDPVIAGDKLTYTITLSNNGPQTAQTVSISDPLPANVTFFSLAAPAGWTASKPAVGATGTVTLTNPSVASGASAVFTLVVKVNANVASGTTLSNTATASSATADPVPANNASTSATTVSASANLVVTNLDSPDPVLAGESITYTVTVKNNGRSDAANVSVSDPLPASVTFVSATAPAGWSAITPAVGTRGTISFTKASLARLATATFTVVAKVNVGVADNAKVSNKVTATSSTPDPTAGNNSATASTTVNRRADLVVTLTDSPDPVHAGQNITYKVKVVNNGPGTASSLSMTDTLPANTVFVSNSGASGWLCTNPAVGSSGTISCTAASAAPAAARTFTIVVKVDSGTANGTTISNTASASSSTIDPNPGNDSATKTTSVLNP